VKAAKVKPVQSSRRWWVATGLAIVLVVVAITLWQARSASSQLVGGGVVEPQPATDFTLVDQFGRSQTLSSLRGKPVALTFVYTNCPDTCPLIAANMHLAYLKLGSKASSVAMVAVTVDPERDDVAQTRRFSGALGLTDEWLFLTGSRPQLEAVWSSYGIYASAVDAKGRPVTPTPDSPELIEHSSPVFLLDKKGDVRMLLPIDFTADVLVTDLSLLASER
jgi:protein SCO1